MRRRIHDVQSLVPTKSPTRDDVLFFAGFYEGEGACVHGKNSLSPVISVAQKDPELLHRARDLWGGSVRFCPPGGLGPSRALEGYESWMNPYWKWYVSGDRARIFIQAIYPYLSHRRRAQLDCTDWATLSGFRLRTHSGVNPERAALRAAMSTKERAKESTQFSRAHKRAVLKYDDNFAIKESIQ